MKKTLLFIAAIFSFNAFSQTCNYPFEVCPGNNNLSLTTGESVPAGAANYGCMGLPSNPAYFYFKVGNPGNLSLTVSGSLGHKIGAICWGPVSSPFQSCNNSQLSTSGSIVNCSYSSVTDTINITAAQTGQFYIFCVNNTTDTAQNLNLQQISGTGSIYCDSTTCNISTSASICFVNTNNTPKNEIYFNHTSGGLQGTIIYRQNASSAWDSIGFVPVNQSDEFIDTSANPNQQKYTYAIAQLDSCGNIRVMSSSHTTILLQSSLGTSGQVNLSWNAYAGVAVPSYYIYRGSTPSNMSLLAQVSSSTYAYTDLTPPTGTNYYKIDFQAPANCTSNATHDTLVGSNYKTNFTTSIDYLNELKEYKIYPNPSTNNITVYSTEIAKSIEITDVLGNTVLNLIPQNNAETISVQNFNKGIYFVKTTNSKGIFCKKLLVE